MIFFQTNFCTKIMNLVCCCRKNPSKYNSNRAENHLEMFFGDQKLRELNTRLVVSAIDNETSTSMFFSADNTPDASVLDAIMCTISAPTYFSPRVFQGREYLDPGFVRNIPIDSLICEIVEEKIDKNNIQVFIVNLNQYTPKEAENTTIPFLRSYIERVCESNRTNDLRILKGLVIEKNIHELSVDFHGDIAMDDTSKRTFDYIHQQAIVSCNENPSFFDKLKDCTEDKLPNESTIDMTNSTLNDTCNMPLLAENQMGTQEESMFQM